jgi:hypothetical protein
MLGSGTHLQWPLYTAAPPSLRAFSNYRCACERKPGLQAMQGKLSFQQVPKTLAKQALFGWPRAEMLAHTKGSTVCFEVQSSDSQGPRTI